MKKKKTICFCLAILTCLIITQTNASSSYSWYCKRTKNNIKPPIPNELSFINMYPAVWQNTERSDSDLKKVAYLTFDAGYENGNVAKILDTLAEKEVTGAFFILINLIDKVL